ncbi:MAG: hypothetical protein LAP39_25855 [Acidobacteriia bacterium]|nr:hypothetical protein [Terriglobia bacterium]
MKTILIMALAVLAAPVFAADANGTWKGTLETEEGKHELTFNLKADGDKLTGTVGGLRDKDVSVDEGKVQGSTITFSVMSEWEGNPIKLVYKGEVSGDEIKFTMGTDDGSWSTDLTAKRVS